ERRRRAGRAAAPRPAARPAALPGRGSGRRRGQRGRDGGRGTTRRAGSGTGAGGEPAAGADAGRRDGRGRVPPGQAPAQGRVDGAAHRPRTRRGGAAALVPVSVHARRVHLPHVDAQLRLRAAHAPRRDRARGRRVRGRRDRRRVRAVVRRGGAHGAEARGVQLGGLPHAVRGARHRRGRDRRPDPQVGAARAPPRGDAASRGRERRGARPARRRRAGRRAV
ncbi:MAG: hypothetical protein AVDCRST_MAG11-496, partial [uncultured Gemmatimonadaceae bacterium]